MAATPKYPKLPRDVTTALFRAIEARLRADPVLHNLVKTWRSWEGKPEDKVAPSISQCPWVRLSVHAGPENWFSPETQVGMLLVQLEVWLEGTCSDDVMNFWGAIRHAIYSPTNKASWFAFVQQLQSLGAHKGLIRMSQPLVTSGGPDDGHWEAVGQLQIEYRAPAAS